MGGFQGFHLHVVIHHQKLVLQIGPGKGAALYLGDAAVLQIAAQQLLHYHADAAFAFAAVALQQHHDLPAICWNQAVAEIFLQGQNVRLLQQLRQKTQPVNRLRRVGIKFNRQAVAAELLFGSERAAEEQRAVGHVNPILVQGQVRRIGFQLKHFQQAGGAFCKTAAEMRAKHFVNLLADALLIGNTTIHGEEVAADAYHGVRRQKILTEHHLVEVLVLHPARCFSFVHVRPP